MKFVIQLKILKVSIQILRFNKEQSNIKLIKKKFSIKNNQIFMPKIVI